ncbi:DUF125 domain-containing protein [Rozella allomycis CSF55]|uniref:DUF125 domain-containing protein n=1 Tax=Rozella allomycis (strain CSF55) TaxID=988480 RepID=A0A075AXL6_ROZAC|nr:DUF125 domain-containing protein [Rozella allomycis CSF55]|eukprot:EPZ33462.1 DUF125 domain-containing protein [Rozella allomycis CSF55]
MTTSNRFSDIESPLLEHEDAESVKSDDTLHSFGHEHYSHRAPWLRAALLGANDGLVSTGSLILGVAAATKSPNIEHDATLISGIAGLVAGSMAMLCGEYISVSSQRDSELADIEAERREHAKGPRQRENELKELIRIYEKRGLSHELAVQVATELSKGDVVAVHARDELGIDVDDLANPVQAALASCISFAVGAGVPLISLIVSSVPYWRMIAVVISCTFFLAFFGAIGSYVGGAPLWKGAVRVLIGGWMAMTITFVVGTWAGGIVA